MNKNKNLKIKEIFELAVKNHQENKNDVAQKLYNQVLNIEPNHSAALNNLGVTFKKLGEYQKAKDCYEKAIEIKPNYIDAHYNLGNVFKELKDYQKAKDCYGKAIEIDPNHLKIQNNLGVIFNKLGEYQKAKDCYEKAIEIKPNYTDVYHNLGLIFIELKDYQKAKDCYEKIIKIDPNYVDAYYSLGAISLQLNDVKDYNTYHNKYYQLKSKGMISNANLENVIPKFVKKQEYQNGIPTFFDNEMSSQLSGKNNNASDFCEIFEEGQYSLTNRFVTYSERVKYLSKTFARDRLYDGLPFSTSQGVHSLIKWKEKSIYKTAYDLIIYSMILQEVKPDVIVELGSGSGGSAIWLADTAAALGLDTHVYSFDINKPIASHKKVTFIEYDLNEIGNESKFPCWESFKGKKIIIEDAHVNLENILHLFDNILKKDDYLIIEDSMIDKKTIISNFMNKKESKYKLDQFFLDFFGTNITCCMNSIFKCT